MQENKLFTRRLTIQESDAETKLVTILNDWLSNDLMLYSYLVRTHIEDKKITSYTVQVCVSQVDRYNTILKQEAILAIADCIYKDNQEYVIGYGQPPLDVMCEVFEPLVNKLSQEMASQWNVPFEDMKQMCYLCMITLYRKGYYVHKNLLTRTLVNYILVSMRKEYRQKPENYPGDLSLDATIKGTDTPLLSVVEDVRQTELLKEIEEQEWREQLTRDRRDLVISKIGERRYEDLVLKVKTGTLSGTDRTCMFRLGRKLRGKLKDE